MSAKETTPPNPTLASAGEQAALPIGLQIMETSPDCIKLLSNDGNVLSVNPPGLELLEVADTADVYGQQWSQLWPEVARPRIENALREAREGRTARFSDFCPTAKGTPKWWDVVVSQIKDDEQPQRILAISRDISAQRSAEIMLAASEQRFRALADNMAQFAWLADASGSLFWYNQRWYDYTGTTLEQMGGWGWRSVHHPDHVERVAEKYRVHVASGEPWEDVFPLRSRDGDYRWFLSRAMPIRDNHGAIILWCGTNTDITEERNNAQRLRQKARLIELSHEAIFVWDLNKGIQSWNRGCNELYGFSPEEAIGKRSHELLQTRPPVSVEELEQTLREKGEWSGQILHRSKSGVDVWVESRQELIDAGERKLVLETNRDVTEKRKSEEMTRLLLGEVVHRVKNTLAIIQSISTQTARRSRSISEFVSKFNGRLQSLSSAHNLLTSTSWSGAEIHQVIAGQVGSANGQDTQVFMSGPYVFLPAQTALQLSLVVFELTSNARKYGALSVPQGRVDLTWRARAGSPDKLDLVWREVGGPPVPAAREQGFGSVLIERFGNQPHLKCELEFAEAGVVCSIAADVCDESRQVTSYFDPRLRAQEPAASFKSESAGLGKRVLIVEDEPLIAMDVEEIVGAAGLVPAGIASTVESALADIERASPDLVVLDGSLYGKPVDQIVERLFAREIPFVIVTGFTENNLPLGVVERGIAVVRKPIEKPVLLAVLAATAKSV